MAYRDKGAQTNMSGYIQKEKTGALFKNKSGKGWSGTFTLDGKKWTLFADEVQSKKGEAYMSLAVLEPKSVKQEHVQL